MTAACMKRALLVMATLAGTAGCVTGSAIKEASGESASIEFVLLDASMPGPRLFWRERPQHAITVSTLSPALPGCERARVFVDVGGGEAMELGDQPLTVAPQQLADLSEVDAAWGQIPDDPCALHVFAGAVAATDTRGIFVSTRSGSDQAAASGLPEDKEAKPGTWFLVPIAPWYDAVASATLFPVFAAAGAYQKSQGPFEEPVTVSFEFPDGRRHETTLDYERANALLPDKIYRDVHSVRDYARWQLTRFWVRAALIELALDHREVQIATETDGWRVELASVDGQTGRWLVDPRDARAPSASLLSRMDHARVLRVKLEAPPTSDYDVAALLDLVKRGGGDMLRRLLEDKNFADILTEAEREELLHLLEQENDTQ